MKKLNRMIALSILAALILALIAIIPASADKPVIERFKYAFDTDFEGCEIPIPIHYEGKYQVKWYFDNDGVLRGGASVGSGGSSATMTWNGHTLTWHNVENSHWEVIGEGLYLVDYTGLIWGVSVPGYGRAVARSGRTLFSCYWEDDEVICDDVLHWSGLELEDTDAVCNYLLNGK